MRDGGGAVMFVTLAPVQLAPRLLDARARAAAGARWTPKRKGPDRSGPFKVLRNALVVRLGGRRFFGLAMAMLMDVGLAFAAVA